jgi:hypothetical protein
MEAAQTLFHRAIELPDGEREARLAEWCGDDRELLEEVQSLVGAFFAAEAEQPADRWIGREVGRYRLERLLGAGGMGAVYLASRSDGAVRMQAAVKVLGARAAGPLLDERMVLERQILAGLEHPNIARLIDGGMTEDGDVYFVMEHVDGAPLDRYAADRQLPVPDVLRLFLKVCEAMEYAHRKLVLHRDLKPANILVGTDGEPKLLDFGNAKVIEADGQAGGRLTRLGFRAFTPEFASPEQVLGGPVSAACDVYSLGVILYRLLAGRPPYEFQTYSSGEFVSVLRDFEPPPPSASAPGLDRDLDAIVAKALQKAPEQRYPTVAALSDDVRRALDGRPVAARPATRTYRLRKFLRRRRRAVAAGAIAVAVAAAGLGLTAWQARRARFEEQRAERQFRNVRELNHALLFELYDAVQALPGSTETQRALAADSIAYLDRLRGETGDAEVAMDVVEAYIRLGNLQGNPYNDNLSEPETALATLRKALDSTAALARSKPRDARVRRLMGLAEQGLGEVYFGNGDPAAAATHLEMAARLLDEAAERPPISAGAVAEAASIHGVLGDIYSGSHGGIADGGKAVEQYERAERLDAQAAGVEPTNERARRGIAVSMMKRAGMIAEAKPVEAAGLVAAALEEMKRLPEAVRHSMPNLRLTAMLHTKLAATLPSLGRFAEGTAHAREGLRIYESLATLDPKNARTKVDLTNSWYYYAESLDFQAAEEGRAAEYVEARRGYRQALAGVEEMIRASPGNAQWKNQAAEVAYRIAVISHKLGEEAEARRAYERSRAWTVEVAEREDAGESELLRAAIFFSSEEVPWREVGRARRYAERLSGTSAHAAYTMARICRLEGRMAEAREAIARAESLLPPGPSYLRRQIADERGSLLASDERR